MRDTVRLRRFATPLQARLAQAVLDSEGIVAVAAGEEMAGVYGGMPTELGGVDLHVRAEDAPRAFEVLAEIERPSDDSDAQPTPRWQRTMAALLLAMFVLPAVMSRHFVLAVIVCIVPAALGAAWIGVMGMRLRGNLRGKGHDWIGLLDASRLGLRAGRAAWHIPPATDVETLPGARRDVDTLVVVARMVEETRSRTGVVVPFESLRATSRPDGRGSRRTG